MGSVGGLADKVGSVGGLAGAVKGKGTVSSLASAAKTGTIKAPSLGSLSTIHNPLLKAKAKAQHGGARTEPLSTEAQVFGAVTVALIGGGVIKGLVDYLITE